MEPIKFELIVAYTKNRGIGYQNQLPWDIRSDLKRFAKITKNVPDDSKGKQNAVIMGRHTWESLPKRPLPGRINLVLSQTLTNTMNNMNNTTNTNHNNMDNTIVCSSFQKALEWISQNQNKIYKVFVIGGAKVYQEALSPTFIPYCTTLHITEIQEHPMIKCDTFFPEIDSSLFEIKEKSNIQVENGYFFSYLTFKKVLNSDKDEPLNPFSLVQIQETLCQIQTRLQDICKQLEEIHLKLN